MKVGIVGGNSQVATELALLFRASDTTVYPIVRNRQGAAFLGFSGFDCRVADPNNESALREALNDVEVVVIAAYADVESRSVDDYKQAWVTNKAIVENSVRVSPDDAIVIHLSSIRAFGNDLFRSKTKGRIDQFSLSKRRLERLTLKSAAESKKTAYSFRLGSVLGPIQNLRTDLDTAMEDTDHLVVECDPADEANVVHTVTVKDAIEFCVRHEPKGGRYTVVNEPQWTWRDTFEHYAPVSTELEFTGRPQGGSGGLSIMGPIKGKAGELLGRHRMKLLPLQLLLPDGINDRIVFEYKKGRSMDRLREGDFWTQKRFYKPEFQYKAAPGPFLEGLDRTDAVIEEEKVVAEALL